MRRSRRRALGCLLPVALAWLATACSTNPATGRREVILMSTEREKKLGEQASQQVESQMGLVRDGDLEAYVRSIGRRLAMRSPRQDVKYEFHVVDLPEANAFALPGGHIYVSRGLLALANSEDELANVLGHEIGHVAARHQAQRETRSTGVGVLATLGTIAAAVAGGGSEAAAALGQLSQIAGAGLLASYGRDQEREADRIGQELAARAGWDPAGMGSFLRSLGRDSELKTGPRRPGFLDSHPGTPERAESAISLARTLAPGEPARIAGSRLEFLARLEGLQVDEDPAAGLFRGDVFVHPDLNLHVAFPNGWTLRNEPTAVGGISPNGNAFIKLEGDSDGTDPQAAAEAFLKRAPVSGGARLVRVRSGEQRAVQTLIAQGNQSIELTWIPHGTQVYRMTAVCGATAYSAYKRIFERTLESVRRLTPEERASIKSRTLQAASSQPGETLLELSKRTGNVWSVEQTAIANGLFAYDELPAGTFVKIAVDNEYAPRPQQPPASSGEPAFSGTASKPQD